MARSWHGQQIAVGPRSREIGTPIDLLLAGRVPATELSSAMWVKTERIWKWQEIFLCQGRDDSLRCLRLNSRLP